MSGGVFLDTSGWLAVINQRAPEHRGAIIAYEEVLRSGGHFVTTELVVAEMHALTVKHRGPGAGLRLLDELRRDPTHDVKYPGREVQDAAIERWLRRSEGTTMDLTDAVSLEVMRQEGIPMALATDPVFKIAGFRSVPEPAGQRTIGTDRHADRP
jgi:hypothetical protein